MTVRDVQVMSTKSAILILFLAGMHGAYAGENVHMSAGFESGQFRHLDGNVDAFWVGTLPENQIGNESIRVGSGGGGPTSNWDTKVLRSEIVGGQEVMPRIGNYFARGMLYYGKDYTDLSDGRRNARFGMEMRTDEHRFDFDDEGYIGFSVFIPGNWEDETGSTGNVGSTQVLTVGVNTGSTLIAIHIYVPEGSSRSHWFARLFDDDSRVEGTSETKTYFDLGPVESDKKKWTDFVIRYRSNPFSVDTNPAKKGIHDAFDHTYKGNKGILQIWKAEGPVDQNGNRKMVRKYSVVNAPVGLVPGIKQGETKFGVGLRAYKYNWQLRPTSVKGPLWIGFDEFRQGQVSRDGTTYSDVHPSGLACTDRCPAGSSSQSNDNQPPPKTPRSLVISP